jgi:hypothetical protein
MMAIMEAHRPIIQAVFAGFMTVASLSTWADTPAPISATPSLAAASTETNAPPAAAAPADSGTTAAAPSNQIWECTTKGLRTFSNNPCGTNPTVRQLNPINVMEPAPVYHVTHTYSPPVLPTPIRNNYSPQPSDAPDETYADNGYNGYPSYVVVTRAHHVRPNNPHNHPHPHHP